MTKEEFLSGELFMIEGTLYKFKKSDEPGPRFAGYVQSVKIINGVDHGEYIANVISVNKSTFYFYKFILGKQVYASVRLCDLDLFKNS